MAFLPLFAIPTADVSALQAPSLEVVTSKQDVTIEETRQLRAAKIDAYYEARSMPLAGKGMTFVLAAEKYGLDWALLPAIAIRESSGGKHDCYNNPFGWGSCKIKFSDYEEAIDTVARNLGGGNPRTASYYAGKTTRQKLYYYNGTVVPTYMDEVIDIMKRIEKTDVEEK